MVYFKPWAILVASTLCLTSVLASADTGPCGADSNWFARKSIPAPKPENFPASPTNCNFHQISWQYFLWLTEPVNGAKLRFETLYSEEAIHPDTKNARNENLHLVFQAGSLGILVDQQGRATYTSIMIDKIYRDFVLDNKLYDPEALQKFEASTSFPMGSLSLKASWKIVEKGEDVSQFYTSHADVQLLAELAGGVGFPKKPVVARNVLVALVGLHIAIVTENHPEAIWATFEHVDNAPNMYGQLKMSDSVSEKDYTFYEAGTVAKDCNDNNASIIHLIDKKTQKLEPVTQTCRQYPRGGGASVNQNNIEAINRSVASQLDQSSVWRNYMEIGAVWFRANNGLIPNWNPHTKSEPPITGSVTLSSAVIETFTQDIVSQNNCFSCHNTMALIDTPNGVSILPGKNVSTSHVVLQNYVKGAAVNR